MRSDDLTTPVPTLRQFMDAWADELAAAATVLERLHQDLTEIRNMLEDRR